MKTTNIINALLLASIIAATGCSKNNEGMSTASNLFSIHGDAEGAQVVPAVNGNGTASISGTYNPTSRLLRYQAAWSRLSGAPTSAAFYSGAVGVNGTAASLAWSISESASGTGNISDSLYLTPEQAIELTSGGWYYSFGTAANPGGEVRGQISATRE